MELKPKFREREFVYFIDNNRVSGDIVYKYVKKSETNTLKYLVGNCIRNEDEIFATRKEADDYIERKTAKLFYDKVYSVKEGSNPSEILPFDIWFEQEWKDKEVRNYYFELYCGYSDH